MIFTVAKSLKNNNRSNYNDTYGTHSLTHVPTKLHVHQVHVFSSDDCRIGREKERGRKPTETREKKNHYEPMKE